MKIKIVSIILIFSVLGFRKTLEASEFEWKIGVAEIDITPNEQMWMAGYGMRNKESEGMLHPLRAKCLFFEDGFGTRSILITTDLLAIPRELSLKLKEAVFNAYHIPKSHVLINSSHTHTGPVLSNSLLDIYPLDEKKYNKVESYTNSLSEKLIKLVDSAEKDLEPAKLYSGNGVSRIQVNRRNNKESEVENLSELKGPNDFAVPVFRVETLSGKVKAIAFGYACHATVLNTYEWSGDYPGFAQLELEKLYPEAVALFFQGAGGDQNPLPRGSVDLAKQYGKSLAASVERVLNEKMDLLSAKFMASYDEISLPLEESPSLEELEKLRDNNSGYVERWSSRLISQMEEGEAFDTEYVHYPIQSWSLGRQLLIALGGEVTVEYAVKLKERLGHDLFVLGYSNDVMNYIPSEKILEEGGYEGKQAHIVYGLPSKWKSGIEERIIRSTVALTKIMK
ncbi:MAG TPA: neutral/alkaline non-lysosomal ceramidase N-terminal domain-containing protein [Chitinophagaceae bacterium]|nr:neutral/alkaline non-lysosomal ceramidase N-terminal domain-containing protein [Chitinophagaceae bacterium]